MKYRYLLGLLLTPTLTHAYAGAQDSFGMSPVVLVVLLTPLVLPPLLVAWAFLQPNRRGLQVVQGLALLGFLWLLNGPGPALLDDFSLTGILPLLRILLPLALLLNGLTQARQAACASAYLAWVGLAVTGAVGLLVIPSQELLNLLPIRQTQPVLLEVGQTILTFGLNLVAWLLVIRLLKSRHDQREALWLPWWGMPTVAVVVLIGWAVLESSLVLLGSLSAEGGGRLATLPWGKILTGMLLSVSLRWLTGAMALRLTAREQTTDR